MSGNDNIFIFKLTYIRKQKIFEKNYKNPSIYVRYVFGNFTLNGTKFHLSDDTLFKIIPKIYGYSNSNSFVVFTISKNMFKLLRESGLNNNLSLNVNYVKLMRFLPSIGQIDDTEFFKLIEDYQVSYGVVN